MARVTHKTNNVEKPNLVSLSGMPFVGEFIPEGYSDVIHTEGNTFMEVNEKCNAEMMRLYGKIIPKGKGSTRVFLSPETARKQAMT